MRSFPGICYEAAMKVRRFNEKAYITDQEILTGLASVLKQKGRLTTQIINGAPNLPSANTVILRFGSLVQAYEQLGYVPGLPYRFHAVNRALKTVKRDQERALLRELSDKGGVISLAESGLFTVSNRWTFEFMVSRWQQRRRRETAWRISYERSLGADVLLAIRMDAENLQVKDYLFVPRIALPNLPLFLRPSDEHLLTPYKYPNLAAIANRILSFG